MSVISGRNQLQYIHQTMYQMNLCTVSIAHMWGTSRKFHVYLSVYIMPAVLQLDFRDYIYYFYLFTLFFIELGNLLSVGVFPFSFILTLKEAE